jgi:hypothetical protein
MESFVSSGWLNTSLHSTGECTGFVDFVHFVQWWSFAVTVPSSDASANFLSHPAHRPFLSACIAKPCSASEDTSSSLEEEASVHAFRRARGPPH